MSTSFTPFYEEKYVSGDNYHERIRNACLCVNANRCAVLGGEVQEIKASIDKIDVDESWEDQAGQTFKSNRDSCSRILGNMITSIDTLFTQSEQLYNNLLQQLDNLQSLDGQYQELLNNEPKQEEYETKETNAAGKEITTYPGYTEAVKEWLAKKRLMEQNYLDMDSQIHDLIGQLQSINGCTLNSIGNINYDPNIANISIPEVIAPISFLTLQYTTVIPDTILQGGYTITGYDRYIDSGNPINWTWDCGKVSDIWKEQGSKFKNGIAVINDNGIERYLIACTEKFGKIGDRLTVNFENGQSIDVLIADVKDKKDSNWTTYGHQNGKKINVLELEVERQTYKDIGTNPMTSTWGLEWDSSSKIVSMDNYGSILDEEEEKESV